MSTGVSGKNKLSVKTVFSAFLIGLMLFFVYLMARITMPYYSFRYDVNFLLTKQAVIHLSIWRQAFYIHITTSIMVLFTGIFQFVRPLIKKRPGLHRTLGKIYVGLILFFSAPSGFVMALYANGGIWAKTSFTIISILWWTFTFLAYKNAREKNFKAHLANMYRSYALTLTAITLRTYVLILPHFIHLHSSQMYSLVAWLSWVPNLIVVELLIRNWKKKGSLIPSRD
jgi:uncharacterized membrane protein